MEGIILFSLFIQVMLAVGFGACPLLAGGVFPSWSSLDNCFPYKEGLDLCIPYVFCVYWDDRVFLHIYP
ncbi:rCG27189, partial [Rattus norvegicus]